MDDVRIEEAAKALHESFTVEDYVGEYDASAVWGTPIDIAVAVIKAADAVDPLRNPRIIEKMLDLSSLPVGSVVRAHWPDNSQPDYQMTRCPEGGASSGGGFGLAGGSQWLDMADWGAVLTVLYAPGAP